MMTKDKTLKNTDNDGARENVPDIQIFNGDMFVLMSKAYSEEEGWMKSTKACQVPGGCIVQVSTQQRALNGTWSVAEALTYVPNVAIQEVRDETTLELVGRTFRARRLEDIL